MFEVELKLEVEALDVVRARLVALGARPAGSERQEDTFFAHPCRDLAGGDETLRLRRRTTDAGVVMELTYKGPRQAADAKVREEETLRLREDPTVLLAHLGFAPQARLTKTREDWELDEPRVSVALDELPGVGRFVEIESLGEDAAAASRLVDAARARLGFEGTVRREPYIELARQRGALAAPAHEPGAGS